MKEQALVAALFLAGCTPVLPSHSPEAGIDFIPNWITLEDVDKLGRENVLNVVRAVKLWDQNYVCSRPITITGISGVITGNQSGNVQPGRIRVGTASAYRDTLAMMTIACKSDQPTMLDQPMAIPDGEIIAFHGLSVTIKMREGKETYFDLFEEGVSERNASIDPTYVSSNAISEHLRRLTLEKFPLSQKDISSWMRNNDVPSFVRVLLQLSQTARVDGDAILRAMVLYAKEVEPGRLF